MAKLEIAYKNPDAMRYGMLTKGEFLAAVEAKAKNKADIARALNVSRAAVTGLFNGTRDLAYTEAVKLADIYDIDPNQLTVEKLFPILQVCLRHPRSDWSDRNVERLAQEILYGLELLRFASPIAPSEDAVEVAARAIAQRFRSKPDDINP